MTTIQQENRLFTLVNVFTVKPENQQKLSALLLEAGETMQQIPGFISASLHNSYDGSYVVNYVQWSTQENFDAMLQHPLALPHMQAAADLAESYNPISCEVAGIVESFH